MKIFIGADHAGYKLKMMVSEHLHHKGYEVVDVGAKTLNDEDDYPRYAYSVAGKILGGDDDDRGVLLCGSGQGMSMAANRVNGVRAALAWSVESATAAREDDNANVLVLPARFVSEYAALEMIDAWLEAKFKADPKYQRRLDELEQLYG
ncbi:MAG TPA: RpiB/LacA/LacB family sugar-phosphate isomerase [Candidatus Saccharimonadia bacterium]|nr:RpiB/LacA/LacB family sugar-phosphate isomerase [Candidatus Saccharimonadia bacterium]